MNHDQIREQLQAFYDEELSGDARREVEAHLGGCPACRQELEEWDRIKGVWLRGPAVAPSDVFVRRVMDRIGAERGVVPFSPALPRWLVPALGVAAAAMFLFVAMPERDDMVAAEDLLLANGRSEHVTSAFFLPGRIDNDDLLNVVMEDL
jgi:anti-sigma factor RsiW